MARVNKTPRMTCSGRPRNTRISYYRPPQAQAQQQAQPQQQAQQPQPQQGALTPFININGNN